MTTVVQLADRKAVPCSGGCGRVQHREVTLVHPVGGGTEVTDGILAGLRAEAEAWKAAPETCTGCAGVAS